MTEGLSVVIPSRDRESALRACVQSLLEALPSNEIFEIIVVDDASRRPPREVIEEAAADGLPITLVPGDGRGPAAARNLGARSARGRWLAFVDDDCRVEPEWARHLVAALRREPRALVGGRVLNARPRSACARAHQSLLETLAAWYRRRGRPLLTSNNLGVSRALFLELGGFDETFPAAAGEDYDLCDRWRAVGPVTTCESARVLHENPASLSSFLRVHRRYGRGSARFRRLAARRGSEAGGLEAIGLYLRIVTDPLRRGGLAGLGESALLLASQVAAAWGALEGRLRPSPSRTAAGEPR